MESAPLQGIEINRFVPRVFVDFLGGNSMKRYLGISFGVFCGALLVAGIAVAKPVQQPLQTTNFDFMESDVVGDVDGSPAPSKALQDTFWIADWTFDTGAPCSNAGWLRWDNRILNVNDDAAFWHIDNRFDAAPNVDGQAAYVSKHDLCWASDGYGNENDFSIIIPYAEDSDPTTDVELAFSGRYHCEAGFDWMTVEVDPLGQSEALTNLNVNPEATPETFRTQVMQVSSMTPVDFDTVLVLPTQALGTSEVYIRFESDGALSDEDGIDSFDTDAAIIIDNIVVRRAVSGVPGAILYSENFEDGDLDAPAVMIETALSTGLSGSPWWRTLPHLTDNDKCVEDLTCAWIDTDPTRIAFLPSMNFGPGQAVVRGWLDDQMTTPWASFATTPGATGTLLTFRVFPGNNSAEGEIRLNYSVRVKIRQDNTDSVADMSDSIDCFSPWGHVFQWFNLSSFTWGTSIQNMTPFFNPLGTEVQVRFREADWQLETLANNPPPMTYNPGPGAYLDRIRIARRVLSGPVINEGIDSRTQAQDAFPTVQNAIMPGQHFSPDADNRFGTCAFSEGTDLGINTTSTNLITGDSIQLEQVIDSRGAGGVTSVKFYGAIVAGPHTGKVPGPYSTVGGFFEVNADSARNTSGNVVANRWFVDLDDTYFRGGDVMKYFWAATDAGMPIGFSSTPSGLTALPSSVAQAETATGGLHEVNYLPTVNWPAAYLTAVAGSMTGDVTYDPMVHGAATQKNCILYYQRQNTRRRSGAANRTTFQLTLDQLGFAGDYDTYDTQGGGNSVNQLAGRANVAQASGYSLIVQDDGRSIVFDVNIPAGQNPDSDQLDQAGWYRSYLANAASGFAGSATLWLIGESTALESTTESNPLITDDFGLTNIIEDQALSLNPNVRGVASQTWANGNSTAFGGDEFALQGGCPAIRNYDMASSTSGSTVTHRYAVGATLSGGGAIVMNRNAGLSWNTVWQGFAFQDIRFAGTPTNPTPRQSLASRIIAQTVPAMCVGGTPTGNGQDPVVDAPPAVSSLHQNVPNPFNPTTKISFDLAREGQVKLQVFNVAGHLVKTLVDGAMPAKRGHEVAWNGLDEAGNRVPSGVYFYQLVTDDLTATKKMALLK
jgi:hypothetical protein